MYDGFSFEKNIEATETDQILEFEKNTSDKIICVTYEKDKRQVKKYIESSDIK